VAAWFGRRFADGRPKLRRAVAADRPRPGVPLGLSDRPTGG
jgi:hypothetical protein